MSKLWFAVWWTAFMMGFLEVAHADEVSDLKETVRQMQVQMAVMQEEIQGLKTQLRSQEASTVSSPAQAGAPSDVATLKEEMAAVEEQEKGTLERLDEMVNFDLYATLAFENFQNTDSAFDARNVELLASAHMTDRLKVYTEIEFERASTTLDEPQQGEIEVEQGWLEYTINDYFKPRFGVMLVPFGKYNLEHFEPYQELTDRPIAIRRIIPTTWAEAGAGFTGNAFLGDKVGAEALKDLSLNYQIYLVNGLTDLISDTGTRDAKGNFGFDSNNNKAFVGRLGISPLSDQEVGVSGYVGDYDRENNTLSGVDVDWHFSISKFELVGEYAFLNLEEGFQGSEGDEEDILASPLLVPDSMDGGYVELRYHFWFECLNGTFLRRGFESPTFTAVLRYDRATIADDTDEGGGDNQEERWTLGLNYRPVQTWVYKAEYQFNETDHEVLERGDNDGFIASVTAAF